MSVLGPEGKIVGWKEQDEHRIQMQSETEEVYSETLLRGCPVSNLLVLI